VTIMTESDSSGNLAVIPARAGSRRIPLKNVKPFGGIPAIVYSISAACASGLFDRVVVTTDSEMIAEIATGHGADVPFLRRPELADDHTPVSLATLDALQQLDPDATRFRRVAQLMPSCPLRTADDVRASCAHFLASGSTAQISVTRYGWQNPWWAMQCTGEGHVRPLFQSEAVARSQDLPALFCPTGAIWWATAERLRASRTFHVADRTGWEIPWQRGIDIDTPDDWTMAEMLLHWPAGRM
jgi:CMP-N-acetylneuraminic acid synthetase